MTHYFFIPGKPYPLKRPRRAANGGMFDPAENRAAKSAIGTIARQFISTPINGAVNVKIQFNIARPKAHFGKKYLKPSAPMFHGQKPDIDNLIKTVFDGLNGVAWADDAQVNEIRASKDWADIFPEGTFVWISEASEA